MGLCDACDIDMQAKIRSAKDKLIKGKKKQKLLAEAKEIWELQTPSETSAAEMIRADRDAR